MKSLLILSHHGVQGQAFVHAIRQGLSHSVAHLELFSRLPATMREQTLVLVDLQAHRALSPSTLLPQLAVCSPVCRVALFNVPRDAEIENRLAHWYVHGVFYADEDFDRLIAGVDKMLQGGYWLPRRLLAQMLDQYRRNDPPQPPTPELTRREQQILDGVTTGASNFEIADDLCLSEHTVKTHLYNIYRKIKVKNRTQAVRWVKENAAGFAS